MLSEPRSRGKITIIFTILVALAGLIFDLSMPLGVAGGVPYVVLVLIGLWSHWKNYVYLMAILGTVLTCIGYFASPTGGVHWMVLTNRALAIFVIWITAILGIRIQRSEDKISAIIDTAADGIISIDEQGLVQSFNKSAESIFGYKANEILGHNVSILMPAQHRGNHDEYIDSYLNTGKTNIIGVGRRLVAQHKHGQHIPIYLNVSEMWQGHERIFTGIIRNLTSEEEKDAQLHQLWRVVEQCPVSIIITDTDGCIEYVNPYFSQVTGYSLEEVAGKNSRILKSGETPPEFYRELWETISSGEVWRGELQNRKKNNDIFWESATICPVYNQDRVITHYIALKEDITDQREKDRMLNQAMKLEAVGRMTDGIAHDFNNLLTIILGNLQLLLKDINSDLESDKALVEDALSAAHDGSELIKRLLGFSRTQEQNSVPIDVNIILNELSRLLHRTIPEDITIRFELADNIDTVLADKNRLESAVLNLVTNARDAMPDGGKLIISTQNLLIMEPELTRGGELTPGDYVVISVKDDGIGMEDKVQQQILEPFYTTKPTGTGLGLSMVSDFISMFGGGLRIDTGPGKGTKISMLLPVLQTEYEQPDKEGREINEPPGGNETILLVEDKESLRRFTSKILRNLGYHLLEAGNAAEAMECLNKNDGVDLLFSDIIMPGDMNGRQLAQQASTTWPALKILLTTGMEPASEEDHDRSIEFELLRKPFTAEQLALSIRKTLDSEPR